MILTSLYEYYHRKAADPENNMAPEGWEWKEIPFVIQIDYIGNFTAIRDTQEGEGRKKRARAFLVPQSVKRTVGISANLCWDNLEYALGANPRNRDDVALRHASFKERINTTFLDQKLPSITALQKFLENNPLAQIEASSYRNLWDKMLEANPFITFSILGANESTICDEIYTNIVGKGDKEKGDGVCLITGESNSETARLHIDIKGIKGANSKGAALVSFNLDPFNSYGKTQNFNAPVSKSAAFAYTTAINTLLAKDSKNKLYLSDMSLIFWSEKKEEKRDPFDFEGSFAWFLSDDKDDPDHGIKAVKSLYEAIHRGALSQSQDRFYILGLAPNIARISIRFFRQGSIKEFGEKIYSHFEDFKIIKGPKDNDFISLFRILASTAFDNKVDNLPPSLPAAVLTSILDGGPYPQTLFQQCMRRVRAERKITFIRAAILKAFINRRNRIYNPTEKEIEMALDPANTNTGYRLGRIFAVLEKIQEESSSNQLNTTIRDRFYGAASTSPVSVFSQLLKLKNHHLAKFESAGRRIYFEKLLGEIMAELNDFPAHLPMREQAFFAIGYYHQRQDFFVSKKNSDTNN